MKQRVRMWLGAAVVVALGAAVGVSGSLLQDVEQADAQDNWQWVVFAKHDAAGITCNALGDETGLKKFMTTHETDAIVEFDEGGYYPARNGLCSGLTSLDLSDYTWYGKSANLVQLGGTLQRIAYKAGGEFGHGDRADVSLDSVEVNNVATCNMHEVTASEATASYGTLVAGRLVQAINDATHTVCVARMNIE